MRIILSTLALIIGLYMIGLFFLPEKVDIYGSEKINSLLLDGKKFGEEFNYEKIETHTISSWYKNSKDWIDTFFPVREEIHL